MVNERQRLQTIEKSNRQSNRFCSELKWHFVRWCWSRVRPADSLADIVANASHMTTKTTNEYYDKESKSTQKWLDDDRQHRQTTASNQQSTTFCSYFRSYETRLCKFHCCSCSTRGDIILEGFACQWCTGDRTDGIMTNTMGLERMVRCVTTRTLGLPENGHFWNIFVISH